MMNRFYLSVAALGGITAVCACVGALTFAGQNYNDRDASAVFQQGLAALREGRYSSAEIAFRQGLTIDPDNWLAHKYLGDTLRKLERPDYDVIREYETSAKLAGSAAAADLPKTIIAEMRDQADRQYNHKRSAARAAYDEQLIAKRLDELTTEQKIEAELSTKYGDVILFSEENITLQGRRFLRPTGASIPLTISLKCPTTNSGIFDKIRRLPDGSFGRVRVRFVDNVADKMIVERASSNGPFEIVFVIARGNTNNSIEGRIFSIISKNVVDLLGPACNNSVDLAKSFQDAVRNNNAAKK